MDGLMKTIARSHAEAAKCTICWPWLLMLVMLMFANVRRPEEHQQRDGKSAAGEKKKQQQQQKMVRRVRARDGRSRFEPLKLFVQAALLVAIFIFSSPLAIVIHFSC